MKQAECEAAPSSHFPRIGLSRQSLTVQVEIYSDGEGKWILEIVDEGRTSHVWKEHFDTDQHALAEAIHALEEEPMEFMAKPATPHDIH